eukprot:CCRYP_002207-RA/>CCRYP_002207-RA protein AED:0.28 eAED:0.28 QI:379/1/1/1/1/1/2/86/355
MSTAELINKGLLMGTIHVLTGPDHLSALATLSATDVGSRSARGENNDDGAPKNWKLRSFLLGVRWGVGHSFGLLVVGGILIGIQAGTTSEDWIGMDDWIPTMLETLVGVFMLVLGVYGVIKALRNRRSTSVTPPSTEVESGDCRSGTLKDESIDPVENRSISEVLQDEGYHVMTLTDAERVLESEAKPSTESIVKSASEDEMPCGKSHLEESVETSPVMSSARMVDLHLSDKLDVADDSTLGKGKSKSGSSSVACKPLREKLKIANVHQTCCMGKGLLGRPATLALLAGVIHGAAGPGGVLGVIPAVEMQDPKAAAVYLGTFCVTSTIVMGVFAALYGTFCKCLAVCGVGFGSNG